MAIVVASLAGCSGAPSLQEVVISDLGEPGWQMIVDTEMDEGTVSFFEALVDSNGASDIRDTEGFWLRVWGSETGMVSIMAGDPGQLQDRPELQGTVEEIGMERTTNFGTEGIILQADTTDELGPAFDVFLANEGHVAFISFMDDFSDELVANTIERQLAAIPEYDPGDQYRGWEIAVYGAAFGLLLLLALRSSKKNRHTADPKEAPPT